MPSVKARLATVEDVQRIAQIHVAAWRDAYRGLIPDEALDDRTVEKRIGLWEKWRDDPALGGHRLYVIEEGSHIKGFAFAGPSDDDDVDPGETVNVGALYIDPADQGSGLGRILLDHVLSEFARIGFGLATLYVLIGNEPAKRFYRNLGWTEEPEVVKECLGDGTPAPQYRYRIEIGAGDRQGSSHGR
jgi:ribosomal protein S18 acetylase RimI-like enzyme